MTEVSQSVQQLETDLKKVQSPVIEENVQEKMTEVSHVQEKMTEMSHVQENMTEASQSIEQLETDLKMVQNDPAAESNDQFVPVMTISFPLLDKRCCCHFRVLSDSQ